MQCQLYFRPCPMSYKRDHLANPALVSAQFWPSQCQCLSFATRASHTSAPGLWARAIGRSSSSFCLTESCSEACCQIERNCFGFKFFFQPRCDFVFNQMWKSERGRSVFAATEARSRKNNIWIEGEKIKERCSTLTGEYFVSGKFDEVSYL